MSWLFYNSLNWLWFYWFYLLICNLYLLSCLSWFRLKLLNFNFFSCFLYLFYLSLLLLNFFLIIFSNNQYILTGYFIFRLLYWFDLFLWFNSFYFIRLLRNSVILDTNDLTVILNQFLCKCVLKIQLFTNINEKHLIWRFSKGWSKFILNKISDDEIGVDLELLFSTSIEEFDEDIDLLFVDMSIVNNMDNVFIWEVECFFLGDSLSFMKEYHGLFLDVNFGLDHVSDLMVGGDFRYVDKEGFFLIGSEIDVDIFLRRRCTALWLCVSKHCE